METDSTTEAAWDIYTGMGKLISSIGNLATKIESWLALAGMLMSAGFFAWLANQWELLASQGWQAVALVSIAVASLMIGAISTAYLSLSKARDKEYPPRIGADNELGKPHHAGDERQLAATLTSPVTSSIGYCLRFDAPARIHAATLHLEILYKARGMPPTGWLSKQSILLSDFDLLAKGQSVMLEIVQIHERDSHNYWMWCPAGHETDESKRELIDINFARCRITLEGSDGMAWRYHFIKQGVSMDLSEQKPLIIGEEFFRSDKVWPR